MFCYLFCKSFFYLIKCIYCAHSSSVRIVPCHGTEGSSILPGRASSIEKIIFILYNWANDTRL